MTALYRLHTPDGEELLFETAAEALKALDPYIKEKRDAGVTARGAYVMVEPYITRIDERTPAEVLASPHVWLWHSAKARGPNES
jgi:hypothetical protein